VPVALGAFALTIFASSAIYVSLAEKRKRKLRRRREEFSIRAGLRLHFQSLMGSKSGTTLDSMIRLLIVDISQARTWPPPCKKQRKKSKKTN
jgi:hypothetical protein